MWVAAAYVMGRERQPSLDRAARWDGLLPQVIEGADRRHVDRADQLADIVGRIAGRREELGLAEAGYDVIVEADSSGEFVQLDPPTPAAWAEAGATWWIESWWSLPRDPDGLAELKRRVQAGPPSG